MEFKDKLKWKKCSKCEFLQHPSHLRCLNCKNDKFIYIESTDKCTLLTYTILKAPPMEFRSQKSYALGLVEFNNGIKALGQLSTDLELVPGMQLKPVFKKICENLNGEEIYSFIFVPL